jgi:CxxC motif-containing protein (DUF1111 family)
VSAVQAAFRDFDDGWGDVETGIRSASRDRYREIESGDDRDDLADGRPNFKANGYEWRTPPLWGIGLTETVAGASATYLHDGRARSVEEASLWHGGEAEAARSWFLNASAEDRARLIAFLRSL